MLKSFLVLLGVIGFASTVLAQTSMSTNRAKVETVQTTVNEDPVGWVPFAAVGVNAVEFDQTLTTRDGYATNGRAIGSYYTQNRNWVFDIGAGVDFADLDGDEVNTGLVELASRARFGSTNKWQFGPVLNFNVGPDAGANYGSSVDSIATFAGLQFARDFAAGDQSIIRAGLKAMTDVGIPNSVANKFLFELQWGQVAATKITESHTVEVKEEPKKKEPVVVKVEEPELEIEAVELTEEPKFYRNPVVVKEAMAPVSLYFYKQANQIGPRNRSLVRQYARFFNRHKNSIKRVQLIGYVDNRVERKNAMNLSLARANQIAAELKSFGIDSEIVIEKLGAGPLTTREVGADLRRARKVDINVLGTAASNWDAELSRIRIK